MQSLSQMTDLEVCDFWDFLKEKGVIDGPQTKELFRTIADLRNEMARRLKERENNGL